MNIYYRYNNAVRHLLADSELGELFHGIVIPATLAKYYKNSLTTFIESYNKPFFIDPMTYFLNVSARNICNSKNLPRKSYKKLVQQYLNLNDNIFEGIVETREDFLELSQNQITREEFCRNVLDFQRNCFEDLELTTFFTEYLSEEICEAILPELLVAPYFLIEDEESYQLNKECIEISQNIHGSDEIPLYGCFTIGKQYLKEEINLENKILDEFENLGNFLIWFSDFDATNESIDNLKRFKEFISVINNDGLNRVINLYGNYYSNILNKFGLNGYCSGITGATKKRARLYKGSGGGFATKVYVPKFHNEILEEDFRAAIQIYDQLACSCTKCQEINNGLNRESPNYPQFYANELMSQQNNFIHALYCRSNENVFINNSSLIEIRNEMEDVYNEFNRNVHVLHLNKWAEVLRYD